MSAAERLDLFPACTQPAPLLIFIHGGYWHSQRKEEACSMAAAFARRGVAVATLEYTLAPEATLAEIVHEVRSAVARLYHHGRLSASIRHAFSSAAVRPAATCAAC